MQAISKNNQKIIEIFFQVNYYFYKINWIIDILVLESNI